MKFICYAASICLFTAGTVSALADDGERGMAPIVAPILSPSVSDSGCYAITSLVETKEGTDLNTRMIDWARQHSVELALGRYLDPIYGKVDEKLFLRSSQGHLGSFAVRSQFKMDGSRVQFHYRDMGEPDCPLADDLESPLPDVLSAERVLESRFDKPNYAVHLLRQSDQLTVWKRPPIEHHFFQYPLRAVSVSDAGGEQQLLFNMQLCASRPGRLDHESAAAIASELLRRLDGEESIAGAGHLIQRFDRIFVQDRSWSKRFRAQYQQMAAGYVSAEGADPVPDDVILTRKLHALRVMIDTIFQMDELLLDDGNLVFDPFVRGLLLEQALWRREEVDIPLNGQLLAVIEALRQQPGQQLHFSLMCYYADLGFPPNDYSYQVLTHCLNGGYPDHVAAAVLARWGWPTQPHHADAVLDVIQTTPMAAERMDAIDTLILMGGIDNVPSDQLEEWFDRRIRVASPARQRRSLNYLLRHSASRAYLLDKWKTLPPNEPLANDVARLLRNQAQATVDLEQYDFISEEICLDTLSALATPTPSPR